MAVINYQNLPSTSTPLNATNLNSMQVIAETTSNANGTAIKFTDGTMICYGQKEYTTAIDKVWGVLYRADLNDIFDLTFPAAFYATPNVMAQIVTNNSAIVVPWAGSVSTTKSLKYMLLRPESTSSQTYTIGYQAIGRWKA